MWPEHKERELEMGLHGARTTGSGGPCKELKV